MTLLEAIKAGIKSVRKPYWSNPAARLELPPVFEDGTHGVWCKLYDFEADGIPFLIFQCGQHETDWEAAASQLED